MCSKKLASAQEKLLQRYILQRTVMSVNNSLSPATLHSSKTRVIPHYHTTTATHHRNLHYIKLRHCQFNFPQPTRVRPTVKWIRARDQISRIHGQLRFNVLHSTMFTAPRATDYSLQIYFEQWFPQILVEWQKGPIHFQHHIEEKIQ